MTLDQAKGLLRRWFYALDLAAAGLPERSADVLVLGPGKRSKRLESLTEVRALMRVAATERFEDVARAYDRLSAMHQEVLWLLYGLGVSYRDVAFRLGIKKHQVEAVNYRALAAFITALGRRVEERTANGA